MNINVYSLRDVKVAYTNLFPFANDETAKRALVNSFMSKEPNPINTQTGDMELWKIGKFDDVTGVFDPTEHYLVGSANDIINEYIGKVNLAKRQKEELLKLQEVDTNAKV